MAAQTFLQLQLGLAKSVTATQVSSGIPDAGQIVALNSSGDIDPSMLPPSGATAGTYINPILTINSAGVITFINIGYIPPDYYTFFGGV